MTNDIILQTYGFTDIGRIRSNNEDNFGLTDNVFIIADGMGGHNAGEIASKLTVDNILNFLNLEFSKINEVKDFKGMIYRAINKTNQIVFKKSMENINLNGMGTTVVIAIFQKPKIMHIVNVGDSRAYLLRNDKLKMLTEDHTLSVNLYRQNYISKEELDKHPYRNQLTRAIGLNSTVEPYFTSLNISVGDKLLLCSDGLWNSLSNNVLKSHLQNDKSPKNICYDLINSAKNSDGTDNITAIVIDVLSK